MAERKRPRRTRERILETALLLFNRFGEPHITTADVAGEMEISPGNLYYHFRNKDQIIAELFAAFERRLDDLFALPEDRAASVEDLWLLLHLLFEAMWDHRFLFRDLDEILSRNRKLASRFAFIMRRGVRTVLELCRGLVSAGAMEASEREIAALAENVGLVA
ncbi:MAG TPA: TetR/AcrR family transcriptional regulator, partial [Casimicrobiaceae bacterium]|nr:TetR/AcrR family transcriptional regulator [Casimicrobiaceae bacterium]